MNKHKAIGLRHQATQTVIDGLAIAVAVSLIMATATAVAASLFILLFVAV